MTVTHRLADSTRAAALAAAGTAVVAAADLLDRQAPGAVVAAIALLVGAVVAARIHAVRIELGRDQVVVHGVLRTQVFAADEVVGITPGSWSSAVELRDGHAVTTLLRQRDLPAVEAVQPTAVETGADARQYAAA